MIVDLNLKSLIEKHNIVDKKGCFDTSCISLTLDNTIKRYNVPENTIISYDSDSIESYADAVTLKKSKGYILQPQDCILACSAETIRMPNFCFGLLQTKGSLARLFVFINCADGQVDPGYHGKITFELYNASNFPIQIKPGQAVGNLYLFKTSMTSTEYNGRYQNADSPTISQSK